MSCPTKSSIRRVRQPAWLVVAALLLVSPAMAQETFEIPLPPESIAPPLPSSGLEGSGTRIDGADAIASDVDALDSGSGTREEGSDTRSLGSDTRESIVASSSSLTDPLELDERHLDIGAPALTESSGTWLRRGWWYGKLDVVFLQRTWNSADLVFAFDNGSLRTLVLENSNPGREEAARLTVGRFLFRDTSNRDHTVEFTYFGGGEFGQNSVLLADDGLAGSLGIPISVDGAADVSFSGATDTAIEYQSRFNSVEWNYVLTSRLSRDRAELQPNGDWIRRTNVDWTYHALFGFRYFDLNEDVLWTATDIANGNINGGVAADGVYDISTDNDAFGPQFGGGLTYESDRFNVTFAGKIGVLANSVQSNQVLSFTDSAAGTPVAGVGFADGDRENTLSFLGQFNLTTRWHLRPNLSIRAGYEALLLTALGLAPPQIDFNPEDARVSVAGDSFYHGISMGLEGYW